MILNRIIFCFAISTIFRYQAVMSSNDSDQALTAELNGLIQAMDADINALNEHAIPLTKSFFDDRVEFDERMKIVGEAISCTLLANNHRGGYPTDNNGIQTFKRNLQ
jgi:hypothetical protein